MAAWQAGISESESSAANNGKMAAESVSTAKAIGGSCGSQRRQRNKPAKHRRRGINGQQASKAAK
jgi:hypothetical protein